MRDKIIQKERIPCFEIKPMPDELTVKCPKCNRDMICIGYEIQFKPIKMATIKSGYICASPTCATKLRLDYDEYERLR